MGLFRGALGTSDFVSLLWMETRQQNPQQEESPDLHSNRRVLIKTGYSELAAGKNKAMRKITQTRSGLSWNKTAPEKAPSPLRKAEIPIWAHICPQCCMWAGGCAPPGSFPALTRLVFVLFLSKRPTDTKKV